MTTSTQPYVEDTPTAPAPPDHLPSLAGRRGQAVGSLLVLLAMVAVAVAVVRRRSG
jgi:hypothetical protein